MLWTEILSRWSTTLTEAGLDELVAKAGWMQPELRGRPPALIGEGISTIAYGWTTPDGGWVLRVARDHPQPWTWRGGRAYEVELSQELSRRGVPVPESPTVVQEVNGLPTAILERRIVGSPLTPEMARSDPQILAQIANLLDRFHAVDISDASAQRIVRDDPTAEFRDALAAVELDSALRDRVEAAVAVLEARADRRVLCHRDFRVEHLIAGDDGSIVGLLDLGEVGIDDPAVDLAFLHGELGPDAVRRICASIASADDGLAEAAAVLHSLWPLLELAPGGDSWGDPSTARARLAALV